MFILAQEFLLATTQRNGSTMDYAIVHAKACSNELFHQATILLSKSVWIFPVVAGLSHYLLT